MPPQAPPRTALVPLLALAIPFVPGCRKEAPPPPATLPSAGAPTSPAVAAVEPPVEPPRRVYPGTRYMARRLERVAREVDYKENIYFNVPRVPWLEQMLRLPAEPRDRVTGLLLLARERLRAGDTDGAIRDYEALLARPPPAWDTDADTTAREGLAVALLRRTMERTCVEPQVAEGCLVPIPREAGVPDSKEARRAVSLLLDLLARSPEDLSHRWLLNLARMVLGEYPDGVSELLRIPPEVFASDYDIGRFRDVARAAGVAQVSLSGGVVSEDFDGDGLIDLLVSARGPTDQLRLYRSRGDGTFEDRTEPAGLTGLVSGLNMVQADYDNDGDIDVLVLRGAWMKRQGRHPNSLLRNEGDGRLVDATEEAGLLTYHPTQTATWADFDGDGLVDLFVGNETTVGDQHPPEVYRNNGDGTFSGCNESIGPTVGGFIKAVVSGDYDNDGRPDVYVSRLRAHNLLLHNLPAVAEPKAGKAAPGCPWRFEDVAERAGVQKPTNSFPAWFWDYDNDGWLDIFVSGWGTENVGTPGDVAADYLRLPHTAESPRLYRNRGDGTFGDVTAAAGLKTVLLAMGCNFGDLDHDGWPDLYAGTGEPAFRMLVPNRMFRNDGGRRFQDVTTSGGFGHVQKGHGIAFVDLDNDGDEDVYAVFGAAFMGDRAPNALFENPGHGNHWVTLRLEGVKSNRAAIGARVRARIDTPSGPRTVHVVVSSGGSFGASSLQQEIGLGKATALRAIEIDWPSGTKQVFEKVPMDRFLRVREGAAAPEPLDLPSFRLGGAR